MSSDGRDGGPRRVAIRIRDNRGMLVSEHSLTKFPAIIGRGRPGEMDIDADVPLDDPRCSRCHALIERDEEGVWLSDQGSTNGTFSSEGKRVTKARLRNRTRIRLGSHWLEFRVEGDEDCTVVDPLEEPRPAVDEPDVKGAVRNPKEQAKAPVREVSLERPSPTPRASASPVGAEEAPDDGASAASSPNGPERKDSPRGKKVSRKGAETGAAARSLFDRLESIAASPITLSLFLLAALAHVLYWSTSSVFWKVAAFVGTAVVAALAAAVLASITVFFARLADRRPGFTRVWRAYICLILVRELCFQLVYDANLLVPERRMLEPWVPLFGSAVVGVYLCFNARWILEFGARRLATIATFWAIGMGLLYLPDLRPQPPLWRRVVARPVLNAEPRRVPASVQVSEDQFLHEMSESLVVLQESKPEK